MMFDHAWANLSNVELESYDEGLKGMQPRIRALVKYAVERVSASGAQMTHGLDCVTLCAAPGHGRNCQMIHTCWCMPDVWDR